MVLISWPLILGVNGDVKLYCSVQASSMIYQKSSKIARLANKLLLESLQLLHLVEGLRHKKLKFQDVEYHENLKLKVYYNHQTIDFPWMNMVSQCFIFKRGFHSGFSCYLFQAFYSNFECELTMYMTQYNVNFLP